MFITAGFFLFLIILIHILGRQITEGGKAGSASNNPLQLRTLKCKIRIYDRLKNS